MDRLSYGVELRQVSEILRMYCRALTGRNVEVLPTQSLMKKGIGWASLEKPSTDGTAIFLPPFIEKYNSEPWNFAWYKVVATHQAAHLEFGSFDFSFEKEASLFSNLRCELAQRVNSDGALTHLERFFDLFDHRRLATDIFTVVEDSRVDYLVKHEYKGLRKTYERIQNDTAIKRRPPCSLPLREAFLELLIRMTLEEVIEVSIPAAMLSQFQKAARILREVESLRATVEDSAEATIRLYALLSQIPNKRLPVEDWETFGLDSSSSLIDDPTSLATWDSLSDLPGEVEKKDHDSLLYASPETTEFRGDFKPELVQLLNKLRLIEWQQEQEAASLPSEETLRELFEKSVEIELPDNCSLGLFVSNLLEEAEREKMLSYCPPSQVKERYSSDNIDEAPLEREKPLTFLYDEWDFRTNDYKPRWCCVRQKTMGEGSADFFEKTLEHYSALAAQIKRQFELLTPEVFRKIKKLPDGEEFELDAVIEAIVEKKAGQSPTEKIYWRRNKVMRDVSVVFLLDMSASTDEVVDQGEKEPDDGDIPDDPRHYLAWSETWQAEEARNHNRRIIDVEKESMVLLIEALETLGDTYGIYGFSSCGRDNVEFYVIKDIGEVFSERVKRRIDKIAPMQTTRMGAAIRHAISKLEEQEAKTKLLFLISDGRPQDHRYSVDGVPKEYGIYDTKMALLEAKRKGIVPFCLTIDRAGPDYLKTMCYDMGYEVVADIESLPKRILALYRRLTT